MTLQDIETSHLSQLRTHVETYCQIVDYNNNQLGRVYQDFQIQLTDLTVENLLEQFTLAKHTGLEKPGMQNQAKNEVLRMQFENLNVSSSISNVLSIDRYSCFRSS